MSASPRKFVWYDVMTTDTQAAEDFYRSVIGWQIQDSGMADRHYLILSAASTMVGGIMPIPEPARAMGAGPAWMGYIGVDDVDGFAARVIGAGGKIHRPAEDIPGVGRFAVAADPHGAGFILFSGASAQEPAAVPPGKPGHVGWHELRSGDLKSAFTFYAGLFGWTKTEALDMGPMGIYQIFASGGEPVGGMMTKSADTPAPYWLYYFNVDGIDSAMVRVGQAGGRTLSGPHQVPTGNWVAHCLDPQGAKFALLGPKG